MSARIAPREREAIAAVVANSNLREVSFDAVDRLLAGARITRLRAGATLHPEGETAPHFELVLSGLVRAYVGAPDGRTLTVRYCRPAAIVGAVSVFARDFALPATLQAIVDSEVLVFAPGVVRSMALADALVADAVLAELSERVQAFIIELRMSAFAPVRQRVARHILDLASESQQSATLVANVNQTELAAACGTVREAVARVLSAFRDEDLVVTRRGGIVILQAQAIAGIAMGEDEHRA